LTFDGQSHYMLIRSRRTKTSIQEGPCRNAETSWLNA